MSRGINKVILIGNLGADPDIKSMPSGDPIANLSLATSENWNDKQSGERREKTEWHRVVAFGRLAEIIGQYCRKGSKLYIEGKLQTRKWTDNQGVEKYSTEIVAGEIQMLDSKANNDENQSMHQNSNKQTNKNTYAMAKSGNLRQPTPMPPQDDNDEALPF